MSQVRDFCSVRTHDSAFISSGVASYGALGHVPPPQVLNIDILVLKIILVLVFVSVLNHFSFSFYTV